jgi:hypothetical protein
MRQSGRPAAPSNSAIFIQILVKAKMGVHIQGDFTMVPGWHKPMNIICKNIMYISPKYKLQNSGKDSKFEPTGDLECANRGGRGIGKS